MLRSRAPALCAASVSARCAPQRRPHTADAVTDPISTGVEASNVVKRGLDVDALSRQYGPMALRRCRRLLRNEDEAIDACQDVFVSLLTHRARLHGDHPASLIYRIATNVCLSRIRSRRRRPETQDDELLFHIASAEMPGAVSEARLLLDRLFRRHPESSRTMATLRFVDGLTLEQVAAETGLSVSGVRKRLRMLRQDVVEMER